MDVGDIRAAQPPGQQARPGRVVVAIERDSKRVEAETTFKEAVAPIDGETASVERDIERLSRKKGKIQMMLQELDDELHRKKQRHDQLQCWRRDEEDKKAKRLEHLEEHYAISLTLLEPSSAGPNPQSEARLD